MLETVLKYKVPIDEAGPPDMMTPMLWAAARGKMATVEWFVAHGANPNAKNSKGRDGPYFGKKTNTLNTDRFFYEAVERGLAKRKKQR